MPIPQAVKDYMANFMTPDEIAAQEKDLEDKGRGAVAAGVAFKSATPQEAPEENEDETVFTPEQTKQIGDAIEYALEFTLTPLMSLIEKMAGDIHMLSQSREYAFQQALETTPKASLKARFEASSPIGNPATAVDGRTRLGRAHPTHAAKGKGDRRPITDNAIINDVLDFSFDDVINGAV